MKSTKSIFVVALAALMLVAFTACQPSTIKWDTGNPLVSEITLVGDKTYYEGDAFATGTSIVTVHVKYVDGTESTLTTTVAENKTLAGGENAVKVNLPNGTDTGSTAYVLVKAVAYADTLTVTLPADYKTTYSEEEYEDWTPASTAPADVEKVELLYEDGTVAKTFEKADSAIADGKYTIAWDNTDKTKTANIVVKALNGSDEIEYKIPLTITRPGSTASEWQIQVNGEAGTAVTVTWGDVKADAVSQISVVEVDVEGNVLGTVDSGRYQLLGLPAKFDEYEDAPATTTPDLEYTVTLVATNATDVKYVPSSATITVTVEDPIDWSSLKFGWASTAAAKFVVGGSVEIADIEITALTTAAKVDVKNNASVSAIASNNFEGLKEGDKPYVNFIIEVTDGAVSDPKVIATSVQQRIQTEPLKAST